MKQKHYELLKSYFAGLSIREFFVELEKSILNIQSTNFVKYSTMYEKTLASHYLTNGYLNAALNVTSSQPSVGPGEFLFASLFKNIGFAQDNGDLIELNSNAIIEVKRTKSAIYVGSKEFIELSDSKMKNLIDKFKIEEHKSINTKLCLELISYIKASLDKNKDIIYIGMILQNLQNESRNLAKAFLELVNKEVKFLYDSNEATNLYYCIIAMHLYSYCKLRNISWFIATTEAGFKIFKSPINLFESYNMLKDFKITTWPINGKSASIILR